MYKNDFAKFKLKGSLLMFKLSNYLRQGTLRYCFLNRAPEVLEPMTKKEF